MTRISSSSRDDDSRAHPRADAWDGRRRRRRVRTWNEKAPEEDVDAAFDLVCARSAAHAWFGRDERRGRTISWVVGFVSGPREAISLFFRGSRRALRAARGSKLPRARTPALDLAVAHVTHRRVAESKVPRIVEARARVCASRGDRSRAKFGGYFVFTARADADEIWGRFSRFFRTARAVGLRVRFSQEQTV